MILKSGNKILSNGLLEANNLLNGLVSYHRFENNLLDSFGTNHGTNVGGVSFGNTLTGPRVDNYALFNGSNCIDGIGNFDTYKFIWQTGVFTISFRLYSTTNAGGVNFFGNRSVNAFAPGFFVSNGSSTRLGITIHGGVSGTVFGFQFNNTLVNTAAFVHYAFVGDGEVVKVYRNGTLLSSNFVAMNKAGFSSLSAINTMSVGRVADGSISMKNGDAIDELAIYNRTLTNTEIFQLYTATNYTFLKHKHILKA